MKQGGGTPPRLRARDGRARKAAVLPRQRELTARPIATGVFLKVHSYEYLRPGFHPNDRDHREIIAQTLERLKRRRCRDGRLSRDLSR